MARVGEHEPIVLFLHNRYRTLGGEELSPIEIHQRYEQIAVASLGTALILTQRDSAVQIIASSENSALRDSLSSSLSHSFSQTCRCEESR